MKRLLLFVMILSLLALSVLGTAAVTRWLEDEPKPGLLSFGFSAQQNRSLKQDVVCEIIGNVIYCPDPSLLGKTLVPTCTVSPGVRALDQFSIDAGSLAVYIHEDYQVFVIAESGEMTVLQMHFGPPPEEGTRLLKAEINAADNLFLEGNLRAYWQGTTLRFFVSPETNLARLRLSLKADGKILQNGRELGRKATLDFTQPVTLEVTSGGRSQTYTLIAEQVESTLPRLYLPDSENLFKVAKVPEDDFIYGNILTVGEGMPGLLPNVTMERRGSSSRIMLKRSFNLDLSAPVSLLGMAPSSKWALRAVAVDKSYMRDRLARDMAGFFDGLFMVDLQFVDVYYGNNYLGIYQLSERMLVEEGRLPAPEVGGYLIESDNRKQIRGFITSLDRMRIMQHIGDDSVSLADAQIDARRKINLAEQALSNGAEIESYYNVPRLVDWYLFQLLTRSADTLNGFSMYFYLTADGIIEMGPLWDYDRALGNYGETAKRFLPEDEELSVLAPLAADLVLLWENEYFRDKLRERWRELRELPLSETFNALSEEYARQLAPSAVYEAQLWAPPHSNRWDNLVGVKDLEESVLYLQLSLAQEMRRLDRDLLGLG